MPKPLDRLAFNIAGEPIYFYGGPLDKKVVRVPYGVEEYNFRAKDGWVHTYRVLKHGANYESSRHETLKDMH